MRHIFAILGKNHNVSVGCTSAGALVLRTEMGRVGGMYQHRSAGTQDGDGRGGGMYQRGSAGTQDGDGGVPVLSGRAPARSHQIHRSTRFLRDWNYRGV
jgi:hypothetical protein